MIVNVTWHNRNPNTIWNKLCAKLGREPTNTEVRLEVQRIKNEAYASVVLPHQRRRRP